MASTSKSKDKTVRTSQYAENLRLNDSEIELIKTEFNEKLHEYFLSTRNSEEPSLMDRSCHDLVLLKIKEEKVKSGLDSSYMNIYQDKYMTVESLDGKERLLKIDDDGKFKAFLPWEDIFDIFWEAHLKYCHPGTETLKNILQEDYIVSDFAIQNIYEVCYICSIAHKPYMRCTLDVISMSSKHNYAFHSIIVYQDMYTGFIHLRPLSVDNKESEICIELLKIFMDFGPPKEIVISSEMFRIAIDQINHLTMYACIPIEVTKVKPDKRKIQDLLEKILDWLKDQNIHNWSIGCSAAQYYFNNESVGPHQKSAFANVFKKLESFTIKDALEEELKRSKVPSSNDDKIEKIEREVLTVLPIELKASSHPSGRTSEESVALNTSSSDEEQLDTNEEQLDTNKETVVGTVVGMETEYTITSSDDDLAEFEEKDPLDIDDGVL